MYKLSFDNNRNIKKDRKLLAKNEEAPSKIRQTLQKAKKNPFEGLNIKKLEPKSSQRYRIRSGDFRIICSIDQGNQIIIIHRIATRKDIYK